MSCLASLCLLMLGAPARGLTFDTHLKSVAIFRDGYGFYTREGEVKLENGWASTNISPNAIRGTVWVYAIDSGDRVDEVITARDNKIEATNPTEIKAKLSDKIGLPIVVVLQNGQRIEGQLARLLDDMLLIQNGAAYNAVPYNQIKSISLLGYPMKIKVATANPNKTARIGIAYLQEGIRWEPSYILTMNGSGAELELRASMQNTTENLDKSEVMFVVGSPFVSNRGMQDMIGMIPQLAAGPQTGQNAAEAGTAQAPPPVVSSAPQMTVQGEGAGELFYYTKSGLSLANGDTAMVSVLKAPVKIKPLFEWNADGEEVVNILKIMNGTSQPLTTGPVFVLENGKALGQENIKYTPSGSEAEVRLSRGIGIRVDRSEAETHRGSTVHIGKSDFIPVTLKGTLTASNFRSTTADMKITKTARGRIVSISDDGSIKNTELLNGEVNAINELVWRVSIPAGQTKKVTYTIESYIFADRSGTPPVPATPQEKD